MIDCEMSSWISGECSKTCGGGIRNVTRHVISGSGGQNCDQRVMKTENCNENACVTSDTLLNGDLTLLF